MKETSFKTYLSMWGKESDQWFLSKLNEACGHLLNVNVPTAA
jgi:hypothetical protein